MDPELVARICRAAVGAVTAGGPVGAVGVVAGRSAAVDVVADPLDGTLWVHLPSPAAVGAAVTALRGRGLDAAEVNDHRLHVTGWEPRLLRWRLGSLLAAVDDLTDADDLTADLVRYHHDRRASGGGEVEPWAVLADVEGTLRAASPLPHPAPRVEDPETLLALVAAAGEAYQRLVAGHLDRAERLLTTLITAGPAT